MDSWFKSHYNLKVSSLEVPKQDWFNQNLHDAGIRAEAKNRFADGMLDRNDLIAILRETENNNVINATEIQDLGTLVNNASYLKNGSSKPGILELTESEIKTSFSYWDSTIAQSVTT